MKIFNKLTLTLTLGLATALVATLSFSPAAWADEWDKRWENRGVEYIEQCHPLTDTRLEFKDCVISFTGPTLHRLVMATRGNIRAAEYDMIDVEQFRRLLQLSEDELPRQEIINQSRLGTGKGMMWNFMMLPRQTDHVYMLNEQRLTLARQTQDRATSSEQRALADRLVAESLDTRERLREAVAVFQQLLDEVVADFADEVHPDHRRFMFMMSDAQS